MEAAHSATSLTAVRSEHGLVAAARQGDDRAFEALYEQYRERVYAFVLSKVRDHGRAEDICQEVFMSALRQLRGSEQTIAFKPWIYAIAKNACIDEFRRTARGREVPVESGDELDGSRGMLSVVPTPPAAVESKQRLDDLRGAFGGLSDSHHRLLVMRELEGRSYDEIGEQLGMTRQMVESGIFRARRKLSDEYEELASGRRCDQVQTVIDTGAARTLRSMGIKQRRRVSRHLSHCEPCRQHARLAGVDQTLLRPRSLGEKIAAILPFGGLWKWRPWHSVRHVRGGSHGPGLGVAAAGGAGKAAGFGGISLTFGQAAATVAVLAIAGGGGVAYADHAGPFHRTVVVRHSSNKSGPAAAGSSSGSSSTASSPGTTGTRHATGSAGTPASTHATTAGPAKTSTGASSTAGHRSTPTIVTRRELGHQSSTGSGPSGAGTPGAGSSGTTSSGTGASPTSGAQTGTSPARSVTGKATAPTKVLSQPGQTLSTVTAPVQKVVAPVLSPPPAKQGLGDVGSLLNPTGGSSTTSTPSAPTSSSSGSASSGGSDQSPLSTVKKVLGLP